jgi:hypothetical protein
MEALLVGALTAMTVAVGAFLWQLQVRPRALLHAWGDEDGWLDAHPGALVALRYALGGVLILLGFLTGLALTFLTTT